MDPAILDTDILPEVLKRKDQRVLGLTARYLAEYPRLAFSALTVYEIVRGLRANQATRQLDQFLNTLATSEVYPVTMPVLLRAAELWAEARSQGHPHNDADLIIASTALLADRVLVTGNTQHISWIPELRLEDWRQP